MFRRVPSSLLAINRVTIFGSGTMGGGIAQVTATAGIPATVVDVNDEVLGKNKDVIAKSIGRVIKKKLEKSGGDVSKAADGVSEIMSRIQFTTDAQTAVKEADLVVEAVVEFLEVKNKLWTSIDGAAPANAIFATNTSSLSVNDQANSVPNRKEHFAGLHFFSPVAMMKLVEVVKLPETKQQVIDDLMDYSKRVGKVPIVCKDTKGFVVNRLLCPLTYEGFRLAERGVASPEDIDTAMKLGAGFPLGIFQLADSVGLDLSADVWKSWHEYEPENVLWGPPSKLITDKIAEGKLGMKSGEGFYKYNKK